MTKIDCRNLACPAPVIEAKKAIEALSNGDSLGILLNSESSKENVLRLLRSLGLSPNLRELDGGEFEIIVSKNEKFTPNAEFKGENSACSSLKSQNGEFCSDNATCSGGESVNLKASNPCNSDKNAPCKKILFLKSDSVGNGELGKKLIVGFLDTLKSADNAPSTIICVNEAVLINTEPTHAAHAAMSELANSGIEVISCGSCLEFYGKTKDLKIGRIGNALEILNLLFDKDKVVGL